MATRASKCARAVWLHAHSKFDFAVVDSLIFSVNATFPIFLTMLVGMLLHRLGMMDQAFTGHLNTFVFKIALPVLLFQDLASQDFVAAWDGRYVLFCFLATVASMVGIVLLARVLVRDVGQCGGLCRPPTEALPLSLASPSSRASMGAPPPAWRRS